MKTIVVPKNKQAEQALDYDEADDSVLLTWELSDAEFAELWNLGVFEWLNRECGVIIDEFEDERITYQKLLKIRKRLIAGTNANVAKMAVLMDEAIARQTGIYFYF